MVCGRRGACLDSVVLEEEVVVVGKRGGAGGAEREREDLQAEAAQDAGGREGAEVVEEAGRGAEEEPAFRWVRDCVCV